MARSRQNAEGPETALEDLVKKVGPENLVGAKLFAAVTLEGSKLYEVTEFDQEDQKFRIRDPQSGRNMSLTGYSLREFEIGLASREPDDPLILLLEANQIPVTPFIRLGRPPSPRREAERRATPPPSRPSGLQRGVRNDADARPREVPLAHRSGADVGERMGATSPRRDSLPSVRNRDQRSPPRENREASRRRERTPSPRGSRRRARRSSSPSSSSSEASAERGERNRTRGRPAPRRRRRRSTPGSSGETAGSGGWERSMSRRALVAHVEDLMRDRRASGMQAELRRFQAAIPPEKKGLSAQFEMGATIQAAPKDWRGHLALALCLGTILKALNMSYTFLAEATFTFARQRCEDMGRELSERKSARIEAEIWEFFRKQRMEGEKMSAKSGAGASSNNRNGYAALGRRKVLTGFEAVTCPGRILPSQTKN